MSDRDFADHHETIQAAVIVSAKLVAKGRKSVEIGRQQLDESLATIRASITRLEKPVALTAKLDDKHSAPDRSFRFREAS